MWVRLVATWYCVGLFPYVRPENMEVSETALSHPVDAHSNPPNAVCIPTLAYLRSVGEPLQPHKPWFPCGGPNWQ